MDVGLHVGSSAKDVGRGLFVGAVVGEYVGSSEDHIQTKNNERKLENMRENLICHILNDGNSHVPSIVGLGLIVGASLRQRPGQYEYEKQREMSFNIMFHLEQKKDNMIAFNTHQ